MNSRAFFHKTLVIRHSCFVISPPGGLQTVTERVRMVEAKQGFRGSRP